MANTLRIKRRASGAPGAPAGLLNAELAFNEVDNILYYGKGADTAGNATTIAAIAGIGAFVDLSTTQTIGGSKTFSSAIIGNLTGTASNATLAATATTATSATSATNAANTGITEDVSTATAVYPTWVTANTGNLPQKTTSTKLSFIPSTGILTATGFSGPLTGNVTGTASNATLAATATTATSATSATNATNVGITQDTATASAVYPVWVTANTGNLPAKVTSTKLSFVPSTGMLTATGFTGPLTGTASNATLAASATVWQTARNLVLAGDVTGTLTSVNGSANVTATSTLATVNTAVGTYGSSTVVPVVTVNAKGLVTNVTTANIPTTITVGSTTLTLGGTVTTITGLAAPTNDSDAATKLYVDSAVQGLDPKQSVKAASTANIATLSGTMTIDGIALIAGDRILVKDQTTTSQNGIYVVAAGAWSRSLDANAWDELVSAYVFVEQGTTNAEVGFLCTVEVGGTLNTTAVTWVQFSGAGSIIAGAGLTKTGNSIDIGTASATRIVVNADNIDLATTGVSASTYRSVTVDIYGRVTGGTNPTTLAGYGITDAQALDATLTALAGVTTSANTLIYATGADTFTTTSLTAFGRSLIDDADAATGRGTLGLGTIATQNANAVAITGGTIDGITFDGGTF